jgi:hypothetical protein
VLDGGGGGVVPERVEIGGHGAQLHQSAGTLSWPERRFPPPWSIEETDACFIVRDGSEQALSYVYFEDEPGRRAAAKLLTREETGRMAANFTKLSS